MKYHLTAGSPLFALSMSEGDLLALRIPPSADDDTKPGHLMSNGSLETGTRNSGMLAATTVLIVETAVMATDHQVVNWAHGWQASADNANTILCRRP